MRRFLHAALGCAFLIIWPSLAAAETPDASADPSSGDAILSRSPLRPQQIFAPHPADRIRLPKALQSSKSAMIDACVRGAMSANNTPGAVVSVIENGLLTYEQAYGVKQRGFEDPVTTNTYFRIGSVTKMLTAAAVMQQVDAGAVSLDDPLTLYVPELALAGQWPADRITVRHLLTHTSGYPDNFIDVSGATVDDALAEWAVAEGGTRLHAPPGSFWNYSNPNFSLAALVVERATGISYHDYMQARVLEPAGLERTTFLPSDVIDDGDWSYGYAPDPAGGDDTEYRPDSYDNWAFAPAGFALSTAGDLSRWALLMMDGGGDVLSESAAAEMQQPFVDIPSAPLNAYGYGIFSEQYEGLAVKHHGGNIPGWGTFLLWIPEQKSAIAVVGNTFAALTQSAYCIVDYVFGAPGQSPPDLSTHPERWPSFVGTYPGYNSIGIALDIEVELEEDGLHATLTNPLAPRDTVRTALVPAFWDTFVIDVDRDGSYDLDLTFHTSEGAPGRTSFLVNRSWVGMRSEAPHRAGGRR